MKHISFRKLKTLDLDADLEKLVDRYNNTLRLLSDRHAPIMLKKVLLRFNVHWMNSDIIEAKRQRRKAERKWRTTKCQSDLILFQKNSNYVTFLMNKARQDYYSDLISNNSNDLKHLFKVSKNLLNIASTPVLPPHEDKQQLANEMGAFFIGRLLTFVPISIIIHHKSAELAPMTLMTAKSISLSPSLICYPRRRCTT